LVDNHDRAVAVDSLGELLGQALGRHRRHERVADPAEFDGRGDD